MRVEIERVGDVLDDGFNMHRRLDLAWPAHHIDRSFVGETHARCDLPIRKMIRLRECTPNGHVCEPAEVGRGTACKHMLEAERFDLALFPSGDLVTSFAVWSPPYKLHVAVSIQMHIHGRVEACCGNGCDLCAVADVLPSERPSHPTMHYINHAHRFLHSCGNVGIRPLRPLRRDHHPDAAFFVGDGVGEARIHVEVFLPSNSGFSFQNYALPFLIGEYLLRVARVVLELGWEEGEARNDLFAFYRLCNGENSLLAVSLLFVDHANESDGVPCLLQRVGD
mmetsp:Transcript_7488/g.12241  ORF Transcript_7488/g.12241 Transcript_7488/m.12241 type:complete len:280 (-) Transcript_7488:1986-2825(-)